jgi:hypothetical protein
MCKKILRKEITSILRAVSNKMEDRKMRIVATFFF